MRIYLRDYLSKSDVTTEAVTSAFHYFDKNRTGDGYMIGLVSSRSPNSYDSGNINRFVWNGIVDQFSDSEGGSIDRLRKSVKSGKSKMIELIKNGATSEDGVDLNFVLLHFIGNTIYFGYFGSTQIHIFHEDELVDVTSILDKSNVNVGSTNLAPSDLVILNSGNFWELNPSVDKSENLVEMLVEKIDSAVVKDGAGVIMASLGVDFEKLLSQGSGPEILDRSTTTLPTVIELDGDIIPIVGSIDESEEIESELPTESKVAELDEDILKNDEIIEPVDEIAEQMDDTTLDDDEFTKQVDETTLPEKTPVSSDLVDIDQTKSADIEEEPRSVSDIRSEATGSVGSSDKLLNSDKVENHKDQQKEINDLESDDPFLAYEFEESLHERSDIEPHEMNKDKDPQPKKDNIEEQTDSTILDKTSQKFNSTYLALRNSLKSLSRSKENDHSEIGSNMFEVDSKVRSDSVSYRSRNISGYINRYLFNPHGRRVWIKRSKARLSQAKLRTPSFEGMKLGGYKDKADKRKRWLIVIGGIVLIGVILLGVRQASILSDQMKVSKNFESFYETVVEDVDDAEKLAAIDPDAASLALLDYDRKFKESGVQPKELNKEDRAKYDSLLDKVLGVRDKIERVDPMSEDKGNLEVFSEIRININNAKSSDIAIYKDDKPLDHLIISDPGSRSVYVVSTSDAVYVKLPDSDNIVTEPLFVDIGEKGIYIYDAQKGGLRALYGANKNEFQNVSEISGASKGDMSFERPEEFAVLTQNDNLYYLDAETASVYKSSTTSGGSYSLPTKFISDTNLSSATDLFADFSVYVTADGPSPFNRFISVAGEFVPSNFAFRGVNGNIEGISAGYTDGDLNKILFLFNPHTKRIMLFEKPNEGEGRHPGEIHLIKQYEYRGEQDDAFENVKDIVASTDDELLYILDGDTIWKLKIEK